MSLSLHFFVIMALLVLTAAQLPQYLDQSTNTEQPAFPWMPQTIECNFTMETGHIPTCLDCSSIIRCTPVGGIVIDCSSFNTPYCNDGYCSMQPSEECADNVQELLDEDQLLAY